ncbi:DUF5819 family protein [Streptomyces sp. NPDC006704]|uniref:DUF5819 family protein n=1 Tax=Streptomyces sp. NPDC006704 TaxID=3364760 RepID=UPI00367BE239
MMDDTASALAGESAEGLPYQCAVRSAERPAPLKSAERAAKRRRYAPILMKAATNAAVVLCLATALTHVLLVFLHVAPSNPLSRRYSRQVNAWIFPLFEQNWRLFAPDPESVNQRISARTLHTDPDGTARVSGWFDLTAVDNAAVRHNPFPSHIAQNMLRRAWSSYLENHVVDDQPRSPRAVMTQRYLANIATDRVKAARGGSFKAVQLRVVTVPIAAPVPTGSGVTEADATKMPARTRYLPWWRAEEDSRGD